MKCLMICIQLTVNNTSYAYYFYSLLHDTACPLTLFCGENFAYTLNLSARDTMNLELSTSIHFYFHFYFAVFRDIDGKSTTDFFKQTKISLRIYIAVDVIIYVESLPGISITIFFQSNMTSMKLCKIRF